METARSLEKNALLGPRGPLRKISSNQGAQCMAKQTPQQSPSVAQQPAARRWGSHRRDAQPRGAQRSHPEAGRCSAARNHTSHSCEWARGELNTGGKEMSQVSAKPPAPPLARGHDALSLLPPYPQTSPKCQAESVCPIRRGDPWRMREPTSSSLPCLDVTFCMWFGPGLSASLPDPGPGGPGPSFNPRDQKKAAGAPAVTSTHQK
ncbi:uncharacterized protein LOC116659870 [Camelus ferus]|uniref:Uncharacterized protein LOC116659870 n=1 Tax=Camelus ferus TaxID=419612 RepID=A0A8B8S2T1_CAMFR|nr:uncharacterized protein LOC116659870 [Camelus ferus]